MCFRATLVKNWTCSIQLQYEKLEWLRVYTIIPMVKQCFHQYAIFQHPQNQMHMSRISHHPSFSQSRNSNTPNSKLRSLSNSLQIVSSFWPAAVSCRIAFVTYRALDNLFFGDGKCAKCSSIIINIRIIIRVRICISSYATKGELFRLLERTITKTFSPNRCLKPNLLSLSLFFLPPALFLLSRYFLLSLLHLHNCSKKLTRRSSPGRPVPSTPALTSLFSHISL